MGNLCECTHEKEENNSPTKTNEENTVTGQPKSRNKQQIAIDEISIDISPKQAPDIKLGEKNKNDKDRKKKKKEKGKENKKKEKEKKKSKKGQENNDTFTGIGEDSQGQGPNASEANSSRHIAQNTGDGLSLPQAAHKYISNERLSTADKGISEEQGQNERKSMDSRKPDTNNKTNTNSKTSANQDNGQSKESSSNTDRGGSQGRGLKDGQVDEPGNQLKKDNEAKKHKQSTGQTKGNRHIAQNTGDGLSLPQAAHKYISNERLSTADKGIFVEQGQNERKSMDSGKPDTNNKTNTNSKTSANQDNGQSSELSSNADKGRSRGQGMNAGQVSVSGKEFSSNIDKRGSQGHGLNKGQVNEPGNQHKKDNEPEKLKQSIRQTQGQSNLTTNTGRKSGSQQSMTSQKSGTSGNVTSILVNQSGTLHSQTSQKDETSRSIETSQSATTKSAESDKKPEQIKSLASGTSESHMVTQKQKPSSRTESKQEMNNQTSGGEKTVEETGIQTDLKYITESQYNKELKEREDAQKRLLKEKEEEITKLRAGVRGEQPVLETGIQTDLKYITESQYNKELKERKDAQRRLKEKEEEITKLIAERQAELEKITHDRENFEKNKQLEIARIQSEKVKLEKEKEELLTRLSAMAGRKLTDNNPNIADLSDLNRPTKLAEKFSELYDNAWTDAFSVVQEQEGYKDNDEKAVKVLLDILTAAYMEAHKAAEEELKNLKEIIDRFQLSADEKNMKDVMKQLKDSRKKKVLPSEELKQVYHTAIEKLELDVSLSEKLKEYKDQCLDLCWLMVIQDPPVFLQCEACKEGDKFDKNTYREYTQGGDKVAFAVWPALFLEKGGALLSKGVVQCKKRPMSASFNSKTGGLDVKAILSKPKSQSLKMQGNSKLEIPKAFQTEMRIPDAEKNENTQNSDERRDSGSGSEYL